MLFSSITFVFLFMPIVCLTYLLARKEIRNYLLLLASILFYAWGEPTYLAIMILTILANYFGAIIIDKYPRYKLLSLWATIAVDLGFLFYFKYFNFVVGNLNRLFTMDISFIEVIMPIGISFYTFQAMSYLIDVYRREVPVQKDIYKLALYIALFPQLVAGPIVKYHDVNDQIDHRTVTFEKVSFGVKRFILGLAKKMLIANTLGAVVDKIFELPTDQIDAATSWMGALFYTLQLYYDFSGYSDMAIGLGLIFGFQFMENFNYPYISKSITEFWRRWHISLSTWFKQYLYIPLGGNRKGMARTYLNLFLVFLATGLWHGAEWTFVFWGLWNGIFIIMERLIGWNKKEGSFLRHFYTIFVFIIGWVLFRAPDMEYALGYINDMFGRSIATNVLPIWSYIDTPEILAFVIGTLCAMPVCRNILNISNHQKVLKTWLNIYLNIYLFALFVASCAAIAASTYNPFIYFRF